MVSRETIVQKSECSKEVTDEEAPLGIWDYGYPNHEGDDFGILGLDQVEPYPLDHTSLHVNLNDFQDFSSDLASWDIDLPSLDLDFDFDSKPFNMSNNYFIDGLEYDNFSYENMDKNEAHSPNLVVSQESPNPTEDNAMKVVAHGMRYKSSTLELDDIQKHFDIPITRAAKELNVGLTILKKRCRELNIMRWPHRKIKSLKSLIHNVKELGLSEEVGMLENHQRMIQEAPEMELTERTKKLRQACFKANYKKRRSLHRSALL